LVLTARKSSILRLIAEDYISSAQPVSSSTVAKALGTQVSSATVRNEMSGLEQDGYIHRPHVSSGGVPTEKGFRQLVTWLEDRLTVSGNDADRMSTGLQNSDIDVDEWADTAAGILSVLLDTVAFATPLRSKNSSIKAIQLLELQKMLVMLVIVMEEAVILRQVIPTAEPVTQNELEHSRNRLSQVMVGKSMRSLQGAETMVSHELDRQIVRSAINLAQKQAMTSSKERKYHGFSRLFRQPEFVDDGHKARMAAAAVENDEVFSALSSSISGSPDVLTYIGSENSHESLKQFSVILCDYGVEGQSEGVIGVLAPIRMAYQRAIPLVSFTGSSLNTLASSIYG
jgi:heat-inducible transcriptional repressor